jgi:putative hydrolase of the HAD superfamily
MSPLRAALFDFGGVIAESPFEAFARYERAHGLPPGFIRGLNAQNPDRNAWACLERGEIGFEEFCARFEAEAEAAGQRLDARELVGLLSVDVRPSMVEAVRRLRGRFKTGLLTNNFRRPEGEGGLPDRPELLELFDAVVESSAVGVRKPDPRFYELACELLGVEPDEAVFLDDLGVNLKPARALGMVTIKVRDPDEALAELESVVGLPLR